MLDKHSKTYPISMKYLWHKWMILYLSTPFVVYGTLTTFNNLWAVDLTGGWMGDREPGGAGYTLILFLPFYVAALAKSCFDFFVSRPASVTLEKEQLIKHTSPKRKIMWTEINYAIVKSKAGNSSLAVTEYDGRETIIDAESLAEGFTDLLAEFENRRVPVQRQSPQLV